MDVEGEDGRVHIHFVRVEDRGVLGRGKNGVGQPRRERILVRAVFFAVRQMSGAPGEGKTLAL